jgi:hypothetical protein
VDTTEKAQAELSPYVATLKLDNDLKYPEDTDTKEDVDCDTTQDVDCETLEDVKTIDEPVECTTSKPEITYKCTVDGPCFDKEYSSQKSLNVHLAKKHGDQQVAKEKSLHENALQVNSRKKRKENVAGGEGGGV